jgi:hypothetical protein
MAIEEPMARQVDSPEHVAIEPSPFFGTGREDR